MAEDSKDSKDGKDSRASEAGSLNMLSSDYDPRRMAELAGVLKNYSEGVLEKMAAEVGRIMEWIEKGAPYSLPEGYGEQHVARGRVPSYFGGSMEKQWLYFCRPRKVLGGHYVVDVSVWETMSFTGAPPGEVMNIPVPPMALFELLAWKAFEAREAKAKSTEPAPSTSQAPRTGALEASISMFLGEYVRDADQGRAERDLRALADLARGEALREALAASGYESGGGR